MEVLSELKRPLSPNLHLYMFSWAGTIVTMSYFALTLSMFLCLARGLFL